ncbi:MAG: hypothetical protein HQK70_10545 [Desulfamplus sp.]|nr:hypothetical protein [Desulfamplus sp.]
MANRCFRGRLQAASEFGVNTVIKIEEMMKRIIVLCLIVLASFTVTPALAETVVLTDANPDFTITTGTTATVYGTSGANHITIESGANVKLINFPGSNTITIKSDSSKFTVSRSGATVTFKGSDGTAIKMSATGSAQMIVFNDIEFKLIIRDGNVFLGSDIVTKDNMPISSNNIKKTLFIHFYFFEDGEDSVPYSIEKTKTMVEQGDYSILSIFSEISYDKIQIQPTYMGLFSINKPKVDFQNEDPSGGTLVEYALELTEANCQLEKFDIVIMMLPHLDYGYPGCQAYQGVVTKIINGKEYSGQYAWLSGNDYGCYNKALMSHEMGHTFGMGHASRIMCSLLHSDSEIVIDNLTLMSLDCEPDETPTYFVTGDGYGIMGGYRGHPTAYQKIEAGWIKDSQVEIINNTSTIEIDSYEDKTNGIKTIQIPLIENNNGEYISYWIEYRTMPIVDYDDNGNIIRETNQIQIRLNIPKLIDNFGQTQENITLSFGDTSQSKMILRNIGDSFNDPYKGVKIIWEKVNSYNTHKTATIHIEVNE